MVALKGKKIADFIARPDFDAHAILIYGPDAGLVSENGKHLVKLAAGSLDDPFSLSTLSDQDLAGDPGKLTDEASTLSFSGSRRVVWVRNAGSHFAAALENYLKMTSTNSVIIAEAGDLKPAIKLRKLFEQSTDLIALPCYGDDVSALNRLIDSELASNGMKISPDAKAFLMTLLGADRGLSRAEIQKLCLFAFEKQMIEIGDVEQICGDVHALTLDALIDAVGEGDPVKFNALYSKALTSGISSHQILAAAGRHFTQLHLLSVKTGNASNLDQVLSANRPPIHFKRKASIKRQCLKWREQDLRKAINLVSSLEAKSRLDVIPFEAAVSRTLIQLAVQAARLR